MRLKRLVCAICLAPITDDQFIVLPNPEYPNDFTKLIYLHSKDKCKFRKKHLAEVRERWRRTHLQPNPDEERED